MNEKQISPTRIDPELVREIKLVAITEKSDPNISASDAIKFIFEQYKSMKAKSTRKTKTQ